MASPAMPCPYLVGDELCSGHAGHHGRHRPGVPEITGRQLNRITLAVLEPRWWRRTPRCPQCRQPVLLFWRGEPTGPRLTPSSSGRGPCARTVNEYPVSFAPCGHSFRRVLPIEET